MYTKVVEIKSFVKRRGEISRIKMFKPKKKFIPMFAQNLHDHSRRRKKKKFITCPECPGFTIP